MENPKPATPAQAATPGNVPQGPATPSAATPPVTTPGSGAQPEGTVTISTKEFAELQRAKARSLAFDRRADFQKRNPPTTRAPHGEGSDDPEVVEQLRLSQEKEAESDRRAYRAEVMLKVRDLLDKEEFKALPASTRALILKNPHMLSEADNVEEALLDIEEFVRDQVVGLAIPPVVQIPGPGGGRAATPAGHETPPVVSAGAPTPPTAVEEEDISKLTGMARSRAILRNLVKKARGQIK